jgi:hypothetical protein
MTVTHLRPEPFLINWLIMLAAMLAGPSVHRPWASSRAGLKWLEWRKTPHVVTLTIA